MSGTKEVSVIIEQPLASAVSLYGHHTIDEVASPRIFSEWPL